MLVSYTYIIRIIVHGIHIQWVVKKIEQPFYMGVNEIALHLLEMLESDRICAHSMRP